MIAIRLDNSQWHMLLQLGPICSCQVEKLQSSALATQGEGWAQGVGTWHVAQLLIVCLSRSALSTTS